VTKGRGNYARPVEFLLNKEADLLRCLSVETRAYTVEEKAKLRSIRDGGSGFWRGPHDF
jgi:hypothetical protein